MAARYVSSITCREPVSASSSTSSGFQTASMMLMRQPLGRVTPYTVKDPVSQCHYITTTRTTSVKAWEK